MGVTRRVARRGTASRALPLSSRNGDNGEKLSPNPHHCNIHTIRLFSSHEDECIKMADQTEKPESDIVFFLGAGASVEAGVPDTQRFVSEFIKQIPNRSDKKIVKLIVSKLSKWSKENKKDERVDIELLMEALDKLSKIGEEPLLEFYDKKKFLLEGYSPKTPLLEQLKTFVKSKAIVTKDDIRHLEPFLGFIKEYHSLDIFSVNYDICIEQFCDYFQKSYRDGFETEWNPKVFSDSKTDIRLYKLHGSVTWYKTTGGGFLKSMIKSEKANFVLYTGEQAESLMLYPIRKWEYAEPFLENLLALKNKLQGDEIKYCIVIGYSFRDDYIREIFWDSAKKNKELVLILVDPNAYSIYTTKLKHYPSGVPSSINERVVCLPFRFEEIFPDLRATFLNNLKDGMRQFNQSKETELAGKSKPNWALCLKPLANAHHVDKLDEIITEKLFFNIKKHYGFVNFNLEDRARHIEMLYNRLNNDVHLTMEVLFKRCFTLYSNDRRKDANESFAYLSAAVYRFLVQKLSIAVNTDGIILQPNTDGTGHHAATFFYELFSMIDDYINELWMDEKKIALLTDFTEELSLYLGGWVPGKLKYRDYLAMRESGAIFSASSENLKKISSILAKPELNFNDVNLPDVKELNQLTLQTERAIISNIIQKHINSISKNAPA